VFLSSSAHHDTALKTPASIFLGGSRLRDRDAAIDPPRWRNAPPFVHNPYSVPPICIITPQKNDIRFNLASNGDSARGDNTGAATAGILICFQSQSANGREKGAPDVGKARVSNLLESLAADVVLAPQLFEVVEPHPSLQWGKYFHAPYLSQSI
jgi:hypothetical protein